MKTVVTFVCAALIAVLLAGCNSRDGRGAATKNSATAAKEAKLQEIKVESPDLVLENASVVAVRHLGSDRRGDTLVKTDQGSRYYLTVGTTSGIRIGDKVVVKPVADSNDVTVSVNATRIYSGSIAR